MKYIFDGFCNAFKDFCHFLFPGFIESEIMTDEEAREYDKKMLQSDWKKAVEKKQEWE